MPSFRYQSLTAAGDVRTGVVAAASRAAAIRMLGSRGETPTLLEQHRPQDAGVRVGEEAAAAVALAAPVARQPMSLSLPGFLTRRRSKPVASLSSGERLL